MTAINSKPEVFTRKASGLVRVMSPFSAFIYNILTMGLIFHGLIFGLRELYPVGSYFGEFY